MFAHYAIILAILVLMEAHLIVQVAKKSIKELTMKLNIHVVAIFDFGINGIHRCASLAILLGKQLFKQIT